MRARAGQTTRAATAGQGTPVVADLLGLIAVLRAQAREYRSLAPVLEEETRVLIRADGPALADVSARRERVLSRLGDLERERTAALSDLARRFGVEPRRLTMSRLIELLPGGAPALAAVRDELSGLLSGLADLNRKNRFLADRTLSCLRGLAGALAPVLVTAPVYAPTGHADNRGQDLGLLDRRA